MYQLCSIDTAKWLNIYDSVRTVGDTSIVESRVIWNELLTTA